MLLQLLLLLLWARGSHAYPGQGVHQAQLGVQCQEHAAGEAYHTTPVQMYARWLVVPSAGMAWCCSNPRVCQLPGQQGVCLVRLQQAEVTPSPAIPYTLRQDVWVTLTLT